MTEQTEAQHPMTAPADRLRKAAKVAREVSDLMHPRLGEAMAATFEAWAFIAEQDANQLDRVGGPETLALADAFLAAMFR